MGDARGFMKFGRQLPDRRPVPVRLRDWKEVYEPFDRDVLMEQAPEGAAEHAAQSFRPDDQTNGRRSAGRDHAGKHHPLQRCSRRNVNAFG